MNDEVLHTRCPTCRTVFRTNEAQLAVQGGKVRCGECRMVFDGRAQLIDLSRNAESDAAGDAPAGIPDAGHPSVAGDTPEAPPAAMPAGTALAGAVVTPGTAAHAMPEVEAAPGVAEASAGAAVDEDVVPFDWQEPPTPAHRWVFGSAALLLLVLLAGQAVYHFRNGIAGRYPEWRPLLVDACAFAGCRIEPIRGRDDITIESHDLQADPAHQGLLVLQLTLRNRANHAVAFPHLELEVLDIGGQPQVRRAFSPVEYAGGAADFVRGMPAGAEWNVKLFLDASSIAAKGYNLDLFYP